VTSIVLKTVVRAQLPRQLLTRLNRAVLIWALNNWQITAHG